MSPNPNVMNDEEGENIPDVHNGHYIHRQFVSTPAVNSFHKTDNTYHVNPSFNDDFTHGDKNATFFKKAKNALHDGLFTSIKNIPIILITGLVTNLTYVGYLILNRAISQKANESSVSLEQLYLEAQLIKSYEQQNNHSSSNENDPQDQESQQRLKVMKKSYNDHLLEYFNQNLKQKDTESKNNTTSLPTGIPASAA